MIASMNTNRKWWLKGKLCIGSRLHAQIIPPRAGPIALENAAII